MKKKNYFYSVFAIMMAAVLSLGFSACGSDDGGDSKKEEPSIKVNGSSSTSLNFVGDFDGKSGVDYKQSVAVVSTVQWSMNKDADWLFVSPSNGNGANEMVIYPTSENPSSTSRTATITLTADGISATISVTQSGGKPVCYVEPKNIVALYNRMAWEYTSTGTVNKFQYIVLKESELNTMTDKEIMTELAKQQELKFVYDYLSMTGLDYNDKSIEENTTYYIVTIAYDNDDKAGELKKSKITTPAYLDRDKDAYVTYSDLKYYSNWGGFQFDFKKEGYCNTYHVVYGLYTKQINSVVHAFEINYFIKYKKKHWLADGFGWEIILDYPNDHTFTYYSSSLPADIRDRASQIPWAFGSGWGIFKDGTLSSDLIGFQFDLSNYNSAPSLVNTNADEALPNTTYSRSEIFKLVKK